MNITGLETLGGWCDFELVFVGRGRSGAAHSLGGRGSSHLLNGQRWP